MGLDFIIIRFLQQLFISLFPCFLFAQLGQCWENQAEEVGGSGVFTSHTVKESYRIIQSETNMTTRNSEEAAK